MQKFRCTRTAPYQHNCDGRHDPSARSGYYITAPTAFDAILEMGRRFPDEKQAGFTAQIW